jgi:uncharacterized protein (DUF1810 family)
MPSQDSFGLQRFVEAQARVYDRVVEELRQGRKQSHWMWFIFPQLRGLGRSETARFYGLAGLDEARAYLAHPLLGPRLRACVGLMNAIEGANARAVLGSPDDLKFRSCLTLFEAADPGEPAFRGALDRYFEGGRDRATLDLLKETPGLGVVEGESKE